MERAERAVFLYKNGGLNCAQAVAAAYCDVLGLGEKEAAIMFGGFGGGFGGQHEVCGAISAMTAVLGQIVKADPSDENSKKRIYAKVANACKKFKSEHNTIICRNLLVEAKKTNESAKPCGKYVSKVCEILDEALGLVKL